MLEIGTKVKIIFGGGCADGCTGAIGIITNKEASHGSENFKNPKVKLIDVSETKDDGMWCEVGQVWTLGSWIDEYKLDIL